MLTEKGAAEKVRNLKAIADEIDCPPAQLAIAWCARNPRVSTVILGASERSQLDENLTAIEVAPRLDDETMGRIRQAVR